MNFHVRESGYKKVIRIHTQTYTYIHTYISLRLFYFEFKIWFFFNLAILRFWSSKESIPIAVIKYHNQEWLTRENLFEIWAYGSREGVHNIQVSMTQQAAWTGKCEITFCHRGSTEKTGSGARLCTLKTCPQWHIPFSKTPSSNSSMTSPNSMTNWGAGVQICESMGSSFSSNDYYNQFSIY